MRKRISKAAVVIGLTVGFVAVGGGIALAATNGPSVQSGSSVSANDNSRGGGNDGRDDRGGGGDDHGGNHHGGDDHGGGGHH